jgi:hypothetical protein
MNHANHHPRLPFFKPHNVWPVCGLTIFGGGRALQAVKRVFLVPQIAADS